MRKFEDLPVNAQRYVEYIEKTLGVPINFIGVGPSREAVITHWACLLQHTREREKAQKQVTGCRTGAARSLASWSATLDPSPKANLDGL